MGTLSSAMISPSPNSINHPGMEINPLKTACGCPCCRVIKNKKPHAILTQRTAFIKGCMYRVTVERSPGERYSNKDLTTAVLSPCGLHLSMYNCIYRVTPRAFTWRMLQQQLMPVIMSLYGMHLSMYNCIYRVTPRTFTWRMLQQQLMPVIMSPYGMYLSMYK